MAVSQNGLALEYASDALRNDIEIVCLAVLNGGRAIRYAGDELLKELRKVSWCARQ